MTKRVLQIALAVGLFAALGWAATRLLERLINPPAAAPPPAAAAPAETAHIQATFYYGAADGTALVALRRDVPLAPDPLSQGRAILAEQFQPAPAPYVSVIPKGTSLRALYITAAGDAFVDLSREAAAAHPGGSLFELLTVQAIVQSLTSNLPSVRRVQILVDGREVDSLAGHVDLRRPIAPDTAVVR